MKEIDCRGLSCPAPVLNAKKAIEDEGLNEITVIVDNDAAVQNVSRFLGTQNFEVSVQRGENDFLIKGNKTEKANTDTSIVEKIDKDARKIMVMVITDKIGHGDDDLGEKLMSSFLKTLNEMGDDLWRLVFLNSGVKLTIEGANTLSDLKSLEEEGTHILVCGTCLTHFNLLDKKQVGETTNMLDIVTAMQVADNVITI
jgi:selenium metabolism protein YedF